MKLEQKGPINVLSMKTVKKAAKTLLIATVVASQVFTVLPTGSHAAEAAGSTTAGTEAPSAAVVAQKYAPLGATLALDGGVTEKRQQVSTFAEFKAAAESTTVNVIEITGDFQLASNVTVNSNMRIEGNGHTISAASYQVIMKSNSIVDLEDVIMTNVGTKAIFTGYTSSAAPTVNIIDNVQIRGMIMGGSGKLSLSIAGTNNRLVNAERQGMDVDSLEIADNTQIDQLEALETAVKVRSSGSVNIGDNAKINMMSNKGYAFDVSNSALVVGENTVINSASKYGTLKAATLVVKNGADLTLASGDVGNGIYVSGNITIGDNVKVKATGTGTAIYAYNTGASIVVGKDADIDVVSDNGSGIYGNATITFGDRSSLKLRTHDRGIYSAGAATIRFGSVSNQNPQPEDRVKIDIDSGVSYGIYSGGPVIFGDNTEIAIKAKSDAIYASGNSRVDFGANTASNITSSSGDGVNAGGIKFGDNSTAYIKAYTNGLETTNTSGEGISTGKNVNMTIISPNHDGIYTYKDTTFGDNNTISITALNSHAIHTFYGGSVKLGVDSSLYLNAQTGMIQEGSAAATFNVGNNTLVKIESSDYGINTSGSITFAENAKANIRAASGQGNYPAIKANGIVTFNKNSMAYVETLSNTSTTVFDLSGAQSSKLVLNSPKYIDFRQNNRAVAGHIVRGYGNDNASYVSRVEMNNMAKVYAWEHAADWSKATGSEWTSVDDARIPLTYKVGSAYTSYYSGLATGQNIEGFSLFDYSRVSTEGSSIVERPVVSPIFEGAKTVSGTGTAGDEIVVTFPDGKTAKATVDADGKWTVNVPAGTNLVKDQSVLTYQTNGVNDSARVTTKVQADTTVPAPPTVDSIKAGDTTISGKAVPNNTVTVKLPDGTTATGTANDKGEFAITIPAQKADAAIDVTQAGKNGLPSDPTSVVVKSNEKPVITASDKTIKIGDTFNALTGVTATDKEDGSLTADIKVVTNTVDTTKAGVYSVEYSVTDSDKNTTTKTIKVTVNTNEKPVITATDKTINVGDTFNALTDVTATDKEDGNLTADIKVVKNTVDTAKAGTYTVEYSVTDSDKNTTTKTITVTVVSVTAGTITANPFVIGTDAYVKGNLTGDVTKAYLIVDGKTYATINVSGSTYQYYASDKIKDPASKVYIVGLDSTGKELQRTEVAVSKKKVGTITADPFTIGTDNYVKGALTGDVVKAALEVNGKQLTTITVSGTSYQYYAKSNITQPTDQVFIIGLDAAGNVLQRTPVTVKSAKVTAGTVTPSKFVLGTDTYVKGTFTGDVAKVSITVNGTVSQTINTPTSPFQYYAKALIKNVTDIVTVTAYDATGKVLDTKPVTVTKDQGETGTVIANSYKLGKDSYVTGTYTGDVVKVSLEVNGTELQKITPTGGTIKYYAKTQITSSTDVVKLNGYNSAGVLVSSKTVAITTTDGTITANPFAIGEDDYVTGKVTGDVSKVSITVNGVEQSLIPAVAGDYQYYAKSLITDPADVVIATVYDGTGAVLSTATVAVSKKADVVTEGTVTPTAFKIGTNNYVDGTYTGDVAKVELEVNGTKYSQIPASNGTIHYYAASLIKNATDEVKVNVYDSAAKLLDSKTVTINAATGTIEAKDVKVGDSYLTGTATGDVTKLSLSVNDVVQTSVAFIQPDGTYKYYIKALNLKPTDDVKVIGLDAKGGQIATNTVTITN
ncbi:immunoglobulin-like domain-containing protein [Paenilisteria newyorkensis]|uniref:immunoglobulin-like domain-containing protein n=1 Tax=Listeria newyorkensis TaxID=1497681 RepID=UPI000669BB4F|nr:immunoglobulin-like domain-containing protein [Listeria newyorkensis]KMT63380.1 cell wall surface anchor family protein [Listeria newyorkensis]